MTFDEFKLIVDKKKVDKPIWFALEAEKRAEEMDIANTEKLYNIHLPLEYKLFLKEYGGGFFSFVTVYTCNENSDFYIKSKNPVEAVNKNKFIAISDNGVGDLYGFSITNNKCDDKISMFSHEKHEVQGTKYKNLYNFLLSKGLQMEEITDEEERQLVLDNWMRLHDELLSRNLMTNKSNATWNH